jgi:GntR family transcriptional regulator
MSRAATSPAPPHLVPSLEAGGMPLHRQLFLVLRDQIRRGALGPEEALPTEQELGLQFGVSRITVRRALQDLSDQGYVQRRHGRGTFVSARLPSKLRSPELTVKDSLRKAQLETTVEVVELALRPAPSSIRDALALPDGQALYVLRLRNDKTSGEPLMLTETWLPAGFSGVINRKSLVRRAMYEILAGAGSDMGRIAQEVTAEMADPRTARLLQTAIGAPLVRVNRLVYDLDDHPVEHASVFLSPERSRIRMDIRAADVGTAGSGFIAHDVPPSTHRAAKAATTGRSRS